jgi:glutamine amidotransferase-like uncharacterized protein
MGKALSLIVIIFFLLSSPFSLLLNTPTGHGANELGCKIINIALLAQQRVVTSNDVKDFVDELPGYQWTAGSITYILNVTLLDDKDILKGKLTPSNFDAIVVPGGSIGDGESFVRCFPTLRNILWKENMANFIKNGGGYYSVCGGTALITDLDLDRSVQSFAEYAYEKSAFGVTWVKSHYETIAFPFLCHFAGLPPAYIGVAAYVMLSGWNTSDYGIHHYSGACLDCPIVRNNSIFDDYLESTRRIRWVGGPCLVIPENPDREVSVLAYYPALEMSENVSTQVHAWRYTGGVLGVFRAFRDSLKNSYHSGFKTPLTNVYAFLGDWEMTDTIIQTDFSNQPAMTAEIYPNENQARILLTGLHPEYNTWWGGHIQEAEDTGHNTLWDALHRWVNVTANNETFEKQYNYWINRRCISWVAKIPDNDLPPVYGPSQVSDIYPYAQNSPVRLLGNAELANGSASLDVYYRYSPDNASWGPWTWYDTDQNGADGWSWEFYPPNGSGYYQFYSIRRTDTETETPPPGSDAIVYIENN